MFKKTIVDDCIDWNAARYEQVYNKELAYSLLNEELNELRDAQSLVEELDAIGDIVFVAIGVLWKLGCSKEVLNHLFYDKDLRYSNEAELEQIIYSFENRLAFKGVEKEGSDKALYAIFGPCFNKLIELNMQEYFYWIVSAICNSNNTKLVVGKVDPSIKANIDKGPDYISPKKELVIIINNAKEKGFI